MAGSVYCPYNVIYLMHSGFCIQYMTWFNIKCCEIYLQNCAGDKIEKNEMGWACGVYG